MAAFGGYIYFFRLKIVTDRSQLVNQNLAANQSYQRYRQAFGDDDFLVLVLRASGDDSLTGLPLLPDRRQRQQMKSVAAEWTKKLRARPDLYPKIYDRIDWSEMGALALLYVPKDDLQKLSTGLRQIAPELRDWATAAKLETLLARFNQATRSERLANDPQQVAFFLEAIEQMFVWMRDELQSSADAQNGRLQKNLLALLSSGGFDAEGFFFSSDGLLLTVFASASGNSNQSNRYQEVVEFAEGALRATIAELPNPAIAGGLAGMPALEYEEMKTTQRDFARSTIIALILVTALFMWGFRSVNRPALAGICLCMAIGITFAVVWLVIGHLNLLAMIFTVILVSLGIDFAIHFVTHYEAALNAGLSPANAISHTYATVSSPLWMGGMTTGAAFFSAYFTEFAGLSELGFIAGAGLLICFLCMFILYPAMLFLLDTRFPPRLRPRRPDLSEKFLTHELYQKTRRPVLYRIILAAALAVILISFIFGQYHFDTNLLNLQAEHGSINRWQRLLFEVDDRTTFAISTFENRQAMEKIRAQFDAEPDLVRRTESLYPNHEAEKRALLADAGAALADVIFAPTDEISLFGVKREIWGFRQTIRRFRAANPAVQSVLADLDLAVDSLYRVLANLEDSLAEEKLAELQNKIYEFAVDGHKKVLGYLRPSPFSVEHIPELMRERFLGNDGTLALIAYPTKNTWNRGNLDEFVERARRIHPDVFGEIVALYENGRSLIRSFLLAAAYSLVAIFLLIVLWSRSIRSTLLAMLPLLASLGLLLGFMKWGPRPTPWNFANFFGLPILIGIGVDSGIHLVHAWKQSSVNTLLAAGKAVFFSSATSLIGFGILSTSHHLGVGSLGYILFWGIAFCLIISLTLLPVALKVFIKPEFQDVQN